MQNLEHDQFEAAKKLADIGTKIAAGRALLVELEQGKNDFLEGREAEAIKRVADVLAQSKTILSEIGNYHSELVGYSNQVNGFYDDLLYLLQSVERWKQEFDADLAAKNKEIDAKIKENKLILEQVQQARALLAGESEGIGIKRRNLNEQTTKINDEWATLGRAAEEINGKK